MRRSWVKDPRHRRPRRRGSVVVMVLWAVSLGAIVAGALQVSAARQAHLGTHALARLQARWAARAGVERTISILEFFTERPDPEDAFRIYREMGAVAYSEPGDLLDASYSIEHYADGQVYAGPMDEHTKLNINYAVSNREMLLNLPYMTEDIVDAIIDWVDEDDMVSPQGAEAAWYLTADTPYQPRNGFMRSIAELELVVGAYPHYVREEDWNFNNRFDPNEDDGQVMWPDDDANAEMNAGWSRYLTAASVAGGLSASGQPRLYLREATVEEVQERTDVDAIQAEVLIAYGSSDANTMANLFVTPLPYINPDGSVADISGLPVNEALPLDANQYLAVFGELTMDDPSYRLPGKININTASPDLLRDLLGFDPAVADEIIYRRERTPRGFTSLVELAGISPTFNATIMTNLADVLDTTSNVFTITSTGRSETTGLEVQLVVVVDRSTLPVHILEYREQ